MSVGDRVGFLVSQLDSLRDGGLPGRNEVRLGGFTFPKVTQKANGTQTKDAVCKSDSLYFNLL